MHPRIYGTEIEYGVFSWDLVPEVIPLTALLEGVEEAIRTLPALGNGGRLYMDHGKHPEYCTPECLTPLEIVLHEKAGDLLLETLFKDGITRRDVLGSVRCYKTTEDKKGNTYGYHENYLMERAEKDSEDPQLRRDQKLYLAACLTPFLVTRTLYTGAGNVNQGFELSARAKYINRAAYITSEYYRPIVSLKDEPLSDRKQYRRLHLITGEPNLSEYATFLKIGTTALVLDLIEDRITGLPVIENPVKTLHQLAKQTGGWIVPLEGGTTMPAIDVQRIYLEQAARHFQQGCDREAPELQEMTRTLLDLWEATLDALERDPMRLSQEIDWVIEKKLLERYRERHRHSWDHPAIAKADLRYHEIGDRSLFNLLQEGGHVKRLVNDDAIAEALTMPPHTRAKGRVLFIKALADRGIILPSNLEMWNQLGNHEELSKKLPLQIPDPFQTYEEEVAQYVAHLFPQR